MAKKEDKWMQGSVKHPGKLHRDLGIPLDKKIPSNTLEKATHSRKPTLKREAILAENFKKSRKKKG